MRKLRKRWFWVIEEKVGGEWEPTLYMNTSRAEAENERKNYHWANTAKLGKTIGKISLRIRKYYPDDL